MSYLNKAFSNEVLYSMKEAAEKYEYNIFNQSVKVSANNGNINAAKLLTQTGRLSKKARDKDWKTVLKKWLQTSKNDINNYSNKINSELIQELGLMENWIEDWLLNTTDGTDFISSEGISLLSKELQTGKWYNKNANGSISVDGDIGNISGLRKEASSLLGMRDWVKKIDEKGVVIDTVDFKGRHEEGRFDILIKLSKDNTFESRRPIRLEAKSSIDNFVIGSMIEDVLSTASIQIYQDGNGKKSFRVIVNKSKIQELVNEFLIKKYTKGGEFGMANIFPIFTSGNDFMLFSEFIEKSQDNLFLHIPSEINNLSYWKDKLPSEYLELGIHKLNNKIIKKKLNTKVTYGKPVIKEGKTWN